MVEKLFEELSKFEEVEAIALGGSRAGENYDEKSDYDIYIYINEKICEKKRKELFSNFCSYMEIGNDFWEYEDNCILKDGIEIDILYRNMKDFIKNIERVVIECQPSNSYTTCMWYNLVTCKVVYDKNGELGKYKKQYSVNYPKKLKENIIKRQLQLIETTLSAYPNQIKKAYLRNDLVSINHRVAEFLASYFDLIFAINEILHPGEKRLVELCKKNCKKLPKDFEMNLEKLFFQMYSQNVEIEMIEKVIDTIIKNVKEII